MRAPRGRGEFDVFVWVKDNVLRTAAGAVAFIALAGEDGTRPVRACDLGDVMEIHAARRGSISGIAADVLAGNYREHPRDADGELVFNGRSRARERRIEHRQAMDRFWAGSRKAPDRRPPGTAH